MPKQVAISEEVRDVLSRSTIEGAADRPLLFLPAGQLDRALYVEVDKVLKALGGKWDRAARGHRFDRPVDGPLAEALRSGTAFDLKRMNEQFFTPPDIADHLADLLMIGDGTHVLEPSAGAGALVNAAMARGGTVTAVELDAELLPRLREIGEQRHGWLRVCHADFMEWEIRDAPQGDFCDFSGPVDVVLMNPPFGRCKDMAHVERALRFLRPGGQLAAIMSPHWTFGGDAASCRFRDMVRARDHIWTLLPPGSFRSAGTNVQAGFLIITKEI